MKLRALNGGIILDYEEGAMSSKVPYRKGTWWVRIREEGMTEAEVKVMQVHEPRNAGSP